MRRSIKARGDLFFIKKKHYRYNTIITYIKTEYKTVGATSIYFHEKQCPNKLLTLRLHYYENKEIFNCT